MLNEKMKKNLLRGLAVLLALALVIGIGTQFRGGSLKATDEDEAATPVEEATHEVEILEVAPEDAEQAEEAENAEAAEGEEAENAEAVEDEEEENAEAVEDEEVENAEAVEGEEAENAEAAEGEEAEIAEEAEGEETENAEEAETEEEQAEEAEEEEKPELTVTISFENLSEGKVKVGSRIRLNSIVEGAPEGTELHYQWQCSADGENWINVENGNNATYEFELTEENNYYHWHLEVTC